MTEWFAFIKYVTFGGTALLGVKLGVVGREQASTTLVLAVPPIFIRE